MPRLKNMFRWRATVFAVAAFVGFAFTTFAKNAARAADAAQKLNVLFILSDDLRPELGCYGVEGPKTPNIDALAAAGLKFDRAYCQYPLCDPSRSSMLTGRFPAHTGVFDNNTHFRDAHPDWVTLPQYFKNNGYTTVRIGKVFHGGLDDPLSWTEGAESKRAKDEDKPDPAVRAKNSDRFIVLEGNGESHEDYKITEEAIKALETHKDKPFFITCGLHKPHSPPTAPKRFYDMYDVAKIPLPPDFGPRPVAPPGFPSRSITPNADLFIKRDATVEQAKEMKRAYWASLSWVDWNVGRVLSTLDRLGLREKTTVVFWGDHGYGLSEKGKWAKHQLLFEIGARVPLIIRAPGKAHGQACPRTVQTMDIYPTLADICGLPKPQGTEGLSLSPLLSDPQTAWDHPAFTYGGSAKQIAASVRNERWRYAEWFGENGGVMLVDEQNDPHELKNVASDPVNADVCKQLGALIHLLPGIPASEKAGK